MAIALVESLVFNRRASLLLARAAESSAEASCLRDVMGYAPAITSAGLGWGSDVFVAIWDLEPGEVPTVRLASHLIDLSLAGGGRGQIEFAGESVMVNNCSRHVRILPAGVAGRWKWERQARFLHVYLHPRYLRRLMEDLTGCDHVELRPQASGDDNTLRHLLRAIAEEVASGGKRGVLFANGLLQTMALSLLNEYAVTRPPQPKVTGGLTPWRLRRVVDYVGAHMGESISLNELAKVAGMSAFYFSRLFRRSTGMTPHAYVQRERLQRAKSMLREGKLALLEVSESLGFCNQAYFTTVFKRETGVTPNRYREQQRH